MSEEGNTNPTQPAADEGEAPQPPPADTAEAGGVDAVEGDGGAAAESANAGGEAEAEAEAAPAEGGEETAGTADETSPAAPTEAQDGEKGGSEEPTNLPVSPPADGEGAAAEAGTQEAGEAAAGEGGGEPAAPAEAATAAAEGEGVAGRVADDTEKPAEGAEKEPPAEGGDDRLLQEGVEAEAQNGEANSTAETGGAQVSIDFIILPEGYGQTKRYSPNAKLTEIRKELEAELSIPEGSLFMLNLTGPVEVEGLLETEKSLEDYGLRPHDRAGIELRINYYQEAPLQSYMMPDVLNVQVGVYIAGERDVVRTPRSYFPADEVHKVRTRMAQVIQRHARGAFARSRARRLRKEKADRAAWEEAEKERIQMEGDMRHKREIEKRMHPRTYDDFATLYMELEGWRINETNRIKRSDFPDDVKHAALRELLAKETRLLQTIDRLKLQAHSANRDAKIKRLLESMAKPRVWAQSDGETTTVHTPFTTRAKELMDLYNGLRLPLLTVDERLDVLLHVKWTVKEFDCNLTREIVDLIDREADMLNRGRPENSLRSLRTRVANLFLNFIRTPEFNPEAQRFQKVPRELYMQSAVQPFSTVVFE
uniref:IQ motif and ubiquitin-like domain-containing protein n=1 Tax=Chromera velia CCMP2878 TaxID=1169474 RepID=A0A0G4HL22_9ALVE|eukprot:Cvel_7308.t1-p1 / transcript=Cvel_7308.t1 / gene=Cvel_7308 / organism=Chromera_velia_CCMP2878 / gene_product=IQ and ubiquitin-like domain-containing protein, putative / transcript_product=IQ and ubiquitin-like domain-containing protein, putative / location=Cvel_scaffold378:56449-61472(-) / protein_length=594 / sequence_SO=supercontig / SO=protein_coding / is_pseudo=false